ncbi:hypothetical protein ACFP7A_13630 [Sporolactobacillus kofuensis]|uniref:Uncharacterized protein n=1 Tax=Sporolactobacillus kofuensis TaxID=269672 RepID=A0ABW1WGD0_9BACL|nr:hypothetical protein [Sporolactobacillus kofuensis]MCO7177128.1 hypothetical protein [Sporolactobacillus kofuensis]
MIHQVHKKPAFCSILILLQGILGLGALIGGGALIISPDGTLIQMPISLLKYSPFSNFLIPGLILFFILGVYPAIVTFSLIYEKPLPFVTTLNFDQSMYWGWSHSLYIGFILILWITIEMYLIRGIGFVHVLYIILGLSILAVALIPSVRKYYDVSKNT